MLSVNSTLIELRLMGAWDSAPASATASIAGWKSHQINTYCAAAAIGAAGASSLADALNEGCALKKLYLFGTCGARCAV
jgi:hypothetical protein